MTTTREVHVPLLQVVTLASVTVRSHNSPDTDCCSPPLPAPVWPGGCVSQSAVLSEALAVAPNVGPSYYDILGLARSATPAEIDAAFRELARKWHPNVCLDLPNAPAKFKLISEAYDVLGDPAKRRDYDQQQARAANARPGVHPATRPAPVPAAAAQAWGLDARREEFPSAEWPSGKWIHRTCRDAGPPAAIADVVADLPMTPEEACRGGCVQALVTIHEPCPACGGAQAAGQGSCPTCAGRGVLAAPPRHIALTSMRRGLAASTFGKCTARTPCLSSAVNRQLILVESQFDTVRRHARQIPVQRQLFVGL